MDRQTIIILAVGGSALGVLGGVVGTYFSVRNTNGPRERAFMLQLAAVCWVAMAAFLAAMWLTPMPFRVLLWIPCAGALPLAIRAANCRQAQIRQEEAEGTTE
jgi:hypothetical protein